MVYKVLLKFVSQELKFKLRHDVCKLQGDVYASATLSSQEQALFRLVLCRGLYPQLALPDEHNSSRKDSEQAHTHTLHLQTHKNYGWFWKLCFCFQIHTRLLRNDVTLSYIIGMSFV